MAIVGGLRQIRGYLTIGGQTVSVESATVREIAAKMSSEWSAVVPLQLFPGGDEYFSSLSSNSATVAVGINGTQTQLITGECNNVQIDYFTGTVTLTGVDESQRLHQNKSSEKFLNKTRAEVVQIVGERNGFTVEVDPDTLMAGKKFQIDFAKMTDGVSDASIIHKMTELMGARWWTKNGTLFIKTGTSGAYVVQYQPAVNGRIAGNFLGMQVDLNLQALKDLNMSVKVWDDKSKKVIEGTANSGGQISGALNYQFRTGGIDQEHADDLAKKKLQEIARHQIKATVKMVGDPDIDIGMGLQLQGTAFDQKLEIDTIDHHISSEGYTMTIGATAAMGDT